MCGIVGTAVSKRAEETVIDSLELLEYRGYDSAGIATLYKGEIKITKALGEIKNLRNKMQRTSHNGPKIAIGHTRWATHGKVSLENTHPFTSCDKEIAIAHNGIIENYNEIKIELEDQGHSFESDTDSEVAAHLLESELETKGIAHAIISTMKKLCGSFAIVGIYGKEKSLFAAKNGSPLMLSKEGENIIISSDSNATNLSEETPLGDNEFALIRMGEEVAVYNLQGNIIEKKWAKKQRANEPQLKRHATFMEKEIREQEFTISNTLTNNLREIRELGCYLKGKNVIITGCGSSFHAAKFAEAALRHKFKCKAILSSEFESEFQSSGKQVLVAISQSGETADVINAIKIFRRENPGGFAVSMTNCPNSTISRMAEKNINLSCGKEIAVATTKAFTSQIAIFKFLQLNKKQQEEMLNELEELAKKQVTQSFEDCEEISSKLLEGAKSVFFIAKGVSIPISMEGALKLKEVSYIHSESYPSGELKHGPLALIEPGTPVVCIGSKSFEKLLESNASEAKARGATIINLATDGKDNSMKIIGSNHCEEIFQTIALQILAFRVATKSGLNPDKPRNLAKSVTVL